VGALTARRHVVAGLALALLSSGCLSVVDGPQLGEVPDGLGYLAALESARRPLPRRTHLRQLGYLSGPDWRSSVVITVYSGAAAATEVFEARDEYAKRYTSTTYSEVESLAIEGRPAWGWQETQTVSGRVFSVGFTAVVAYKDVSYSIEYTSRDPRNQGDRHLREVVMSFHVVRRARQEGFVLIIAGLLLGAVLWVILRASRGSPPAARQDTVDRLIPH
jgi:hypothetical protein